MIARRHCERSEAIQSNRSMIAALALDCFVATLLAMTARATRHVSSFVEAA
jgi:hypothetical protein